MAYADTIAQIVTHATAAGAALTNPVTDVQRAFPVPRGRCIRVYYGGETEPRRMGANRVLNEELIAERTWVTLFLPISETGETLAAVLDAEAHAFKHDLRTRILGDSQLGGMQTDLEFDYVVPDVTVIGNTRYLVVPCEIISDYTAYPIAP